MSEVRPGAQTPVGPRAFMWGITAAVVATGLWVAMTAAFHLIFHLQPALIGISAGLALRRVAGPGLSIRRAAALATISAVAAVAGGAVIAALHGPMDALSFTVAIAAAGALIGAVLLARARAVDRSS